VMDLEIGTWFIIGLIALVALITIWNYLSRRPKICPSWNQRGLIERSKTPTGDTAINEYGGGGFSGGQTSVRVVYDVTYKCKFCGDQVITRQTRE